MGEEERKLREKMNERMLKAPTFVLLELHEIEPYVHEVRLFWRPHKPAEYNDPRKGKGKGHDKEKEEAEKKKKEEEEERKKNEKISILPRKLVTDAGTNEKDAIVEKVPWESATLLLEPFMDQAFAVWSER